MTSPQQIIEDIRQNTYGIGLKTDLAAKGVIDRLKQSLNNALERLSVDLYSKETHFVLELIQNADDNHYKPEVTPSLTIAVESEKICIQNNECGFSEANARAICDVGNSTKIKALGYIGEKGIGFKSVFRICDEPQIYSNGFQFGFKRRDDRDCLGFVAPHWIEEVPADVDPTLTTIMLPLGETAKDELVKLSHIEHTLILFLRRLKTIKIDNRLENQVSQITRTDKDGQIFIEEATGTQVKQHCYQLVKTMLAVPSTIVEEKRSHVRETELILGFRVREDGTAEVGSPQKVFAFLPTRSYGFKFLIQADFLVPANREDIHKDPLWNQWLRNNIAAAFLSAVERFKRSEYLSKTYYNYIPLPREVTDEFFNPVVRDIHEQLKVRDCLLTESGNWRRPGDVLRRDDRLRELIDDRDLQTLLNKEYLHPEIDIQVSVLDALGVKEFRLDDLIACLQQRDWLSSQSDEWFVKLYSYIKDRLKSSDYYYLPKLKKLKIIRLQTNSLVSTSESSIFFPVSDFLESFFEVQQELPIVKPEILEANSPETRTAVAEFLKKIGVRQLSADEVIERYILPIYESETWQEKGDRSFRYTRYIKDNLAEYEAKKKRESWERKDPLERLKKSLRIKTDKDSYQRVSDLYLPASYENDNDLETLFAGISDISFISPDYLLDAGETPAEIRAWRNFFIKLGANVLPKIEVDVKTVFSQGKKRDYPIYRSPDTIAILSANSTTKNQQLATILNRHWSYYKQYKYWNYYYYNESRDDWERSSSNEADWFAKLKTSAWLPTTNGKLAKPGEVFLDRTETASILGDSVAYLAIALSNAEFIQDLGIKANVTNPKDFADLLSELSQKKTLDEREEGIVIKIYRQLSDRLNPATQKTPISQEPWWRSFIGKAIFWNEKKDFCVAGELLVNDDDRLYDLFKDNPQVQFFRLPTNYHPKLSHLIKAAGIRYLSKVVQIKLAIGETRGVAEPELTAKIKQLIPYIWRYLYQLEYHSYELLKSEEMLDKLKRLSCYKVEKLEINYLINRQSVSSHRQAFLEGETLYIQTDSLADTDPIAVEISPLFCQSQGLEEFLMLLFYKKTDSEIEKLMRTKKIQDLPIEEKQWLESAGFGLKDARLEEIAKTEEPFVKQREERKSVNGGNKSKVPTPGDSIGMGDSPKLDKRKFANSELPPPEIVLAENEDREAGDRPSKLSLLTSLFKSKSEKREKVAENKIGDRELTVWGEKFAIAYLTKQFSSKYPQGELTKTGDGFIIRKAGRSLVEVHWLNQTLDWGDCYDLKVIEGDRQEYIEVKSHRPMANKSIKLSGKQWKFAIEMGENYHLYQIDNAGTRKAKLVDIQNPSLLYQQGSLSIDSICLKTRSTTE